VPTQETGRVVPAAGYKLSGPHAHAGLAVYLVHGPETLDGKGFFTLQEGLADGRAVVHETGSVGELAVENRSAAEELFIQAGDIVKGGKQDRTLPYDAIIGANSGRVPIQSFCVEQGRWTGRGGESAGTFSSSQANLATNDLKRAAYAPRESGQGKVWTNVAKTQAKLAAKAGAPVQAEASRSSLQLTMESPAVRAALAPYQAALGGAPGDKADLIGCVVVVNGRPVSADVYASRALFRKLWPKLLVAAATEAYLADGPAGSAATEDAVRAYLTGAEGGEPAAEGVTERTYVQVRQSAGALQIESCDRARDNLVLHRSVVAR
jgi:hypothetical protein